MKERICFIDDDEKFEIPLFKKVFEEDFDIIATPSFSNCLSEINKRKNWNPNLFVLNIYFPSSDPERDMVMILKENPLQLQNDHAKSGKAFMNYLIAKKRLKTILNALNQSPDNGIALAKKVYIEYPNTPIVFYSRKATLENALNCICLDGVLDVILKPVGTNGKEIEEATIEAKSSISTQFKKYIRNPSSYNLEKIKQAGQVVLPWVTKFCSEKQKLINLPTNFLKVKC